MEKISGALSSLCYALSGIITTIKLERNFRIHLVAAAYVLFFQKYYYLETSEKAILVLTIALVLAAELINTSIEKVIDLQTSQYHKLAKLSKDAAAGAVFIMAAAALTVGFYCFGI